MVVHTFVCHEWIVLEKRN